MYPQIVRYTLATAVTTYYYYYSILYLYIFTPLLSSYTYRMRLKYRRNSCGDFYYSRRQYLQVYALTLFMSHNHMVSCTIIPQPRLVVLLIFFRSIMNDTLNRWLMFLQTLSTRYYYTSYWCYWHYPVCIFPHHNSHVQYKCLWKYFFVDNLKSSHFWKKFKFVLYFYTLKFSEYSILP